MSQLRTKPSVIWQENPRQMHSSSKTSTFSSEVQVHFPGSHCACKCDCIKAVPFCRYRNRGFSHSPKAKKEASQLGSIFGLLTGSQLPETESSRVRQEHCSTIYIQVVPTLLFSGP